MARRTAAKKSARRNAKKAPARGAKKAGPKAPRKAARRAAPRPLGGTLGMVTLHVHDLARALAFYRDTLGYRAGDVIDTPGFGWAEVAVAPGVKLGLHADKGNVEEGARPPGGASGFYFVVPDVDEAIARLRERGVKVVDEPADKPYGRDAYIEDPDGNVLALVTP